jgi:hypothetical protein
MITCKFLFNLGIVTAAAGLLLTSAGTAQAGPPLSTDDAGTVEVGKVEVELNGSYTYDKKQSGGVTFRDSSTDAEIKITTGLYKNLGISLAVPYTISQRSKEDDLLIGKSEGFGDMTVELKYAFAELGGINFAIKPTIIMPTGKYSAGLSEGRWQFGTTMIASKEFMEGKYALHANAGYEYHSYRIEDARAANRSDLWSASIAGECKIMDRLVAVADFGLATPVDKGTNEVPVYTLVGARYEITENMDINAGFKLGLTKPEDDVSLVYGLVFKF